MNRTRIANSRALALGLIPVCLLIAGVANAAAVASGNVEFRWESTGIFRTDPGYMGAYGVFQFDDAQPVDIRVRAYNQAPYKTYDGTNSLLYPQSSMLSSTSASIVPIATGAGGAGDAQLTTLAVADKPDGYIYERAVASANLGWITFVPDPASTGPAVGIGLEFNQSAYYTPNPLVSSAYAASDVGVYASMTVGWVDAAGTTWQVLKNLPAISVAGTYRWDIDPYSSQFVIQPDDVLYAGYNPADWSGWVGVSDMTWAGASAALLSAGEFDTHWTAFNLSIGLSSYASEYGTAAAPPNVPEPGSMLLLGLGLFALGVARRPHQA